MEAVSMLQRRDETRSPKSILPAGVSCGGFRPARTAMDWRSRPESNRPKLRNEKGRTGQSGTALRMVSGEKCRLRSLYRLNQNSAIMPRDGNSRHLCWTMRHRITSFRAVEPSAAFAAGAEGFLPIPPCCNIWLFLHCTTRLAFKIFGVRIKPSADYPQLPVGQFSLIGSPRPLGRSRASSARRAESNPGPPRRTGHD